MKATLLAVVAAAATAACATAAGAAAAQDPASGAVIDRACGLHEADGTLWGLGPDYKMRFGATEVEFVPALGASAPANLPVRIRLLSVGRSRGDAVEPAVPGVRTVDGHAVHYAHDGFVETYRPRPDGVEQSFTFTRLPAGEGDLVVRCRLDTALTPRTLPESESVEPGFGFVRDGVGGVRVGDVTGIDARGARAAGSRRFADGVLELALPAAFVDRAQLPLVLDPLFGTAWTVSASWDAEQPDAASLQVGNADTYFVVWHVRFSSGDADIRGQRIAQNGSPIGGVIGIRNSTALNSTAPRVAPVSRRDRFVVVWTESRSGQPPTVACRSVHAGTGALANVVQLVPGSQGLDSPDVGGDRHDISGSAIAVWRDATLRRIQAARMIVSSVGDVVVSSTTTISGSANGSAPAIAETGGAVGRYLVAWVNTGSLFRSWISGTVIDQSLNVLDTQTLSSTARRVAAPDVDGDGDHWLVAYEFRPVLGGASDIRSRWVTFDDRQGTVYIGADEGLVTAGDFSFVNPAVAFTGASVLVAYGDEWSGGNGMIYRARLLSLDWFAHQSCEGGLFTLEADAARDARNTAIAYAIGNDDALIVWESRRVSDSDGDIKAWRFDVEDGTASRLPGTACGRGGRTWATCARGGYFRVEHAEPNRPAFLILGAMATTAGLTFNCGTCATLLDPFEGFVVPMGTTDVHGNAAFRYPTSSVLDGVWILFQWVVVPSSNPACPAWGIDLSDIALVIPQIP